MTVANAVAKPLDKARPIRTAVECRPSAATATDGPGRCAHSYGADGPRAATGRAGHEDQRRRRAISGPLTPVRRGLSRSLADSLLRRSGHVTGPDGTASQADSAGSIPVTRSTVKV